MDGSAHLLEVQDPQTRLVMPSLEWRTLIRSTVQQSQSIGVAKLVVRDRVELRRELADREEGFLPI
jgi:hypothetical protein